MGTTKKKPVRRVSINRRVGLPKPRVFYGKTKSRGRTQVSAGGAGLSAGMLVAKRKALHLPADSHSLRRLYHRAAAPHPQGNRQCLPSSHQAYPGVFRRHRDERHRRTGGARLSGKDEGSREEQAYHRKCAGRHLLHLFLLVRGVPRHQQSGAASQAALRDAVWPPERAHRRTAQAHQRPPEGCGFWAWLFEYTGLRMGEANGLRWQDVDLAAGTITPMQAMPWYKNQPYKEKLKTI